MSNPTPLTAARERSKWLQKNWCFQASSRRAICTSATIFASRLGVTLEHEHPWFWTLIGVDQALHHLTGFGLSIFMAANA